MICLNCGQEFTAGRETAKFCSPKCRVQYSRATKGLPVRGPSSAPTVVRSSPEGTPPQKPGGPETKLDTLVETLELSKTDQLFENTKPGYYKYAGVLESRDCFNCNKRFSTRMTLLKCCSPSCQQSLLRALAGVKS